MKAVFALILALVSLTAKAQSQGTVQDLTGLNVLFVDIRDVKKYPLFFKDENGNALKDANGNTLKDPRDLSDTAAAILDDLHNNTALYGTSPGQKFYMEGARGPEAAYKTDSQGQKIFDNSTDHPETRKNTIMMAEITEVTLLDDGSKDIQLLLFSHDPNIPQLADSHGYYFSRVSVNVMWNSGLPFVSKQKRLEGFSLNETDFQVYGDILDRRMILVDRSVHRVRIVYPVGVGAMEVSGKTTKTEDGSKTRSYTIQSATPELLGAKVVQITPGSSGYLPNTRSRVYPSYYEGRPFQGLYLGDNYQQVGFHYQIDDLGLSRGFISHACLRTRDKDLYVLDAIFNEGTKTVFPVNLSYNLHDMLLTNADLIDVATLDHPMYKKTKYAQTYYTTYPLPNGFKTATCPWNNQTHSLDFIGAYHTGVDSDCLDAQIGAVGLVQPVIDYIRDPLNHAVPGIWVGSSPLPKGLVEKAALLEVNQGQAQAYDTTLAQVSLDDLLSGHVSQTVASQQSGINFDPFHLFSSPDKAMPASAPVISPANAKAFSKAQKAIDHDCYLLGIYENLIKSDACVKAEKGMQDLKDLYGASDSQ